MSEQLTLRDRIEELIDAHMDREGCEDCGVISDDGVIDLADAIATMVEEIFT